MHHVTVGIHHVTFGLAPKVSSHRQCIVYRDCRVTPDNDLNIVLSLAVTVAALWHNRALHYVIPVLDTGISSTGSNFIVLNLNL